MKNKNIVILGGAGFIGTNLSFYLHDANHNVYIIDHPKANVSRFTGTSLENRIFLCDFKDHFSLEKIFSDIHTELVIHLISTIIPGTTHQELWQDAQLNINSNFKLFEILTKCQIPELIYFSSGGTVYGKNGLSVNNEEAPLNPISLYGWYKTAMEGYIKTYCYHNEINFNIVRPSNPFGEWQKINGRQGFIAVSLGKILRAKPLEVWGDGTVIRDYIFINDLCKMTSILIDGGAKNEIYNIGSGKGYSINELILLFEQVVGKKVDVIYKKGRKADIETNILDIAKITKNETFNLTGIEAGLVKTWDWINENYKDEKHLNI